MLIPELSIKSRFSLYIGQHFIEMVLSIDIIFTTVTPTTAFKKHNPSFVGPYTSWNQSCVTVSSERYFFNTSICSHDYVIFLQAELTDLAADAARRSSTTLCYGSYYFKHAVSMSMDCTGRTSELVG